MYKQDFAKALEYYNKALEVLVYLYVKNLVAIIIIGQHMISFVNLYNFTSGRLVLEAKTACLVMSLVSCCVGLVYLYWLTRCKTPSYLLHAVLVYILII